MILTVFLVMFAILIQTQKVNTDMRNVISGFLAFYDSCSLWEEQLKQQIKFKSTL